MIDDGDNIVIIYEMATHSFSKWTAHKFLTSEINATKTVNENQR